MSWIHYTVSDGEITLLSKSTCISCKYTKTLTGAHKYLRNYQRISWYHRSVQLFPPFGRRASTRLRSKSILWSESSLGRRNPELIRASLGRSASMSAAWHEVTTNFHFARAFAELQRLFCRTDVGFFGRHLCNNQVQMSTFWINQSSLLGFKMKPNWLTSTHNLLARPSGLSTLPWGSAPIEWWVSSSCTECEPASIEDYEWPNLWQRRKVCREYSRIMTSLYRLTRAQWTKLSSKRT